MGRLDISALRYLSKDDFRTLQAVEQGMKNHDLVPVELISSIAALKHGGAFKCLSNLLRIKLIKHDRKRYDGYSLNYLGYDFLAFNTLRKRGVLRAVGRQIGVGKESDVFVALDDTEEKKVVIKLHRLGRTSFRKIKEKRDYHQHRKFANWLYLSRLAAAKEIAFMRCLHEAGFPVPEPIDQNRHCVVMSLLDAYPLTQIRELRNPGKIFAKLMELHIRLAQCGLVHCDFNEFNVMINDDEEITLIDFPQMVSTSHVNAAYYFERDVECLRLFFERRYGFVASSVPKLSDCSVSTERLMELDKVVAASGFTNEETQLLDEAMEQYRQTGPGQANGEEDGNDSDDDEDDDSEEGERVDDDGNAAGDENSSGMVVAAAASAGVDAAEGSEGGVAIGVAGKDKGGKHGGGGGGGPGRDSGSGRGPSGPEDSVSVLGEEYTRLTVCDDAPGDDDDPLDAGASGGGGAIGSSADADNALAAAATAAAAAAAEGSPGGEQYDSEEAEGDGEEGGDGDDADGVDGGGSVGGGGAAGGREGGGIMSGSYDRDDDIRRAWRFSGRPAAKGAADGSSGRGGGSRGRGRGAAGGVGGGRGGLGAAPGGGGAGSDDWRKLARNRVKDRERRKVLDTIRDCT